MSSSFASQSEKEVEEDAESYDSDVDIIQRKNCTERLGGLLFRIAISIVMIGACAGALIWSFNNNEAGAVIKNNTRDPSKDFNISINEYTQVEGTYTITYRSPDSENNNKLSEPDIWPSFWIQDDDGKRLVHRRDNQTTVYVFEHYSYWVRLDRHATVVGCRYDHVTNYQVYITRLGLNSLFRDHSAYETTHNHKMVYIYNGDPSDVIFEGSPQDAFLVTVYADASTGLLIGWDTYFTASANASLVYEISYWYDKMVEGHAPEEDFDPPAECQPVVVQPTTQIPK